MGRRGWLVLPSDRDPEKAVLVAVQPSGPRWVHERKLDGFRVDVFVTGRGEARGARIVSRQRFRTDTRPTRVR